jgi:GGDEF domain-containing protein
VRVSLEALTGGNSHAVVPPPPGEATPGDVVCVMEVDETAALTDALGVSGMERAVRRCEMLLRTHVRTPGDLVQRRGRHGFLVILAGAPLDVACDRMRQVALAWMAEHRAGVSVGVAVCSDRGGAAAGAAAERALLRAQRQGANRLAVATSEDMSGQPD